MTEENRVEQYTDIQLQFLDLLKKYPVKNPETIVDYITSQGETVLEEPGQLAQSLSECEITPVRRRQILKHWFADKGIEVSSELIRKVTLPPEERRKTEEEETARREREKAKYSVDDDTGAITVATTSERALTWNEAEKLSKAIKKEKAGKGKEKGVKYVYDADANTVRMAREGEIGGTLEQAKELKRMAEEGKEEKTAESPFTMDENGNWMLNPKAKVTGVEFMAMELIRRSQEKDEPVDPLEMLAQAADKMKVYQEALGAGKGMPEWMTDPAKFVQIVQDISGGGKGDEGLKQQVASLEKTIADMREDKYREQIEGQQQQIRSLANHISELTDRVADLSRPTTGRTEMDLLHEIATEGIGLAKSELPGMRRDIKEALGSTRLPTPKTAEERKESTEKLRQAVKRDKDIEQLGRRIFFGEDIKPAQ